jgi:hypothetical protein
VLLDRNAGFGPLESIGNPYFFLSSFLQEPFSEPLRILPLIVLLFLVLGVRIQSFVIALLGWVVWTEGTIERRSFKFLLTHVQSRPCRRSLLAPGTREQTIARLTNYAFAGVNDFVSVISILDFLILVLPVIGVADVLISILEEIPISINPKSYK